MQLAIPYQHLLNYMICNIFLVICIHVIYGCIFHICTSSFINEVHQAVVCLVLKGSLQYTLLMTPDVTTKKNRERTVLTVSSPSVMATTTDITTRTLRLAQCGRRYSGSTMSAVKTRAQLTDANRKMTSLYIDPKHYCLAY